MSEQSTYAIPSRARRHRWRKLVLASIATAACLEIGWRTYLFHFAPLARVAKFARLADMPPRAFRFRPHPYLGYCLNESFCSDDGLNRHNALGLRGGEVSTKKIAGAYRIVCIGGSTTYETGVEDDRATYPAQLQTLLRERFGHPEVEVLNAGVPGYTSWESAILLQLRVLALDPDLVVYYDNTNDVHPRLVEPALYHRDNTGYRTAWQSEVPWWDHSLVVRWLGVQMGFSPRNALIERTTLAGFEARDAAAALSANPPVYFAENLANIVVLARRHHADVLLASWASCPAKNDFAATATYLRAFRENNAVIEQVARDEGAAWFDFAPLMPTDPALWSDGAHVNARGAAKKAELFASFIAGTFFAR